MVKKICANPDCKKEFETNDLRRNYCSDACVPELNRQIMKHFLKERWIVLIHYGGDPPKCACCDESYIEFLAIDHIHGGGLRHLKEIGVNKSGIDKGRGRGLYHWLIKNGFPEGFRVLCHNCNNALGFYGYCPHSGRTQEKNENVRLEVIDPDKWVGSPFDKFKRKQFNLRKTSIEYCRNCGGQFRSKGTIINQYGFCRKECHDEWRERERQRLRTNRKI